MKYKTELVFPIKKLSHPVLFRKRNTIHNNGYGCELIAQRISDFKRCFFSNNNYC